MKRTDTIRLTLTANTDTGEGYITDSNIEKLSDLQENPLLAMDVLNDWIGILRYNYALASAGFRGEMTRISIDAETCWRLGYHSQAAFTRAFKKVIGEQPGAFQRARRSALHL